MHVFIVLISQNKKDRNHMTVSYFKLKNSRSKISSTVTFAIGLVIILVATDMIFNHSAHFKPISLYSRLILVGLFLSFLRNKPLLIILTVFSIFIYFESVHFQYYHTLIFTPEISAAFKDTHEIFSTFPDLYTLFIKALIPALFPIIATYILTKTTQNRIQLRHYGWLLFIICLFPLHHLAKHKTHLGARPDSNNNIYSVVFDTTSYYLANQLPRDLGWIKSDVPEYYHPPYAIKKINPKINIIFIQGESLTFRHMSLYGYTRNTTPFLSNLKKRREIRIYEGIPLGPITAVSLPSFFNMIKEPNGIKQILSSNTNLFRMAKANGFETSFISTQSRDALKYIKNYLDPKAIDHYADSSYFKSNFFGAALDGSLVSYLKTIDFNSPQFLVLHEHGCHSSYSADYPNNFKLYTRNNPTFRMRETDSYDDCVNYIDSIYRQIYTYLQTHSSLPTYLVFDSDHGEGLGEQQGYYGHGNNTIRNVINIPIIIAGLHGAELTFLNTDKHRIKPKWMSQFELSKVIAHLLGYQVDPLLNQSEGYYVNGFQLDGSDGFRHLAVIKLK